MTHYLWNLIASEEDILKTRQVLIVLLTRKNDFPKI